MPARIPRLSVVVLNYEASEADLGACVASVVASEGVDVEVVLADNGSDAHGGAPSAVAAAQSSPERPVRVVRFGTNHGFAGGINRALAACDSSRSLVFLLNNDATVAPDCLARCAAALLASPPDVLAVAPKMLSATHPGHLDAVGMAINGAGEAFNLGLGQPDLGQYDCSEDTFGPCFGAAVFRRRAFADDAVGPLDGSYFLYYEDVEWNWRANLLGFRFVTVPGARVWHTMSASTRHLDYGFKFRLIERNLLTTVATHFAARRAAGIWLRRGSGLARGALTGRHYPRESALALLGATARLPRTLRRRRASQRRRTRSDESLLRFSVGERTFFDAVSYEPDEPDAALAAAEARLARVRT